MTHTVRKYPVGIQTFPEVINGGYIYIDKTDIIWNLTNFAKFVFMSRPRRFGKSLLTSTLEYYFKGDKKLFKGLKVDRLENEWKCYPVIHLDLSTAKGQHSAEELRNTLMWIMSPYAEIYGHDKTETSPGKMLAGIIRRACSKTGMRAAVLIDEYDAPLLDVLHDDMILDDMRNVMQEFYQPLKANESVIKFCFITGITKFSQLSIFSTINNIKNVSLLPRFSTICGFTEEEVRSVFAQDIVRMAGVYNVGSDEMYRMIKEKYDGYHFAGSSPAVFNPFSLINAFCDDELNSYWFASGTPSFLIREMKKFNTDITSLDALCVPSSAFDRPTENMEDALPLLYQTGYLTIKGYDRLTQIYTLSIPNQEVRVGYTEGLLPAYTGLRSTDVQTGFALKFWMALRKNDIDLAMQHMQAYLAGIPYAEGFKKKLSEATAKEGFYEYTFYLIFSMLNVYVRTQVKVAAGRADMVVLMPDTIYVIELKTNASAQKALEQINAKGYAEPYKTDGRKVVKVGVSFNTEKHTVDEWATE